MENQGNLDPLTMHQRARLQAANAFADVVKNYWLEEIANTWCQRGLKFSIVLIGPKK